MTISTKQKLFVFCTFLLALMPIAAFAEVEKTLSGEVQFLVSNDSIDDGTISVPARKIKTGFLSAEFEPYAANFSLSVTGSDSVTVDLITDEAYKAMLDDDFSKYSEGLIFTELVESSAPKVIEIKKELPAGEYHFLIFQEEKGMLEKLGVSDALKAVKRKFRDYIHDGTLEKIKNKASDLIEDNIPSIGTVYWSVDLIPSNE